MMVLLIKECLEVNQRGPTDERQRFRQAVLSLISVASSLVTRDRFGVQEVSTSEATSAIN